MRPDGQGYRLLNRVRWQYNADEIDVHPWQRA